MSEGNTKGLGSMWKEIVTSIEELTIAGCYEKVNRVISLGLVSRLRRKTASIVEGDVLLDAGCGPGTSTDAVRQAHEHSRLVMLDPSGLMLSSAWGRHRSPQTLAVLGRFERLPLRDESVQGIVAMFSFRDAVNYKEAIEEFARVLAPGGRVAILDFYRPGRLWKILLKTYLAVMVPVAVVLSRCWGRLGMYRGFLDTIDRMLTRDEIEAFFGKHFKRVEIRNVVPGLGIIVAEK
ncbi:MAG: methyltransferase domain-containing protein [Desulfurococcales archaeon]|nr:methyltransferase domain-containing protein [Desulfurococcales archaeon]